MVAIGDGTLLLKTVQNSAKLPGYIATNPRNGRGKDCTSISGYCSDLHPFHIHRYRRYVCKIYDVTRKMLEH